MKNLRINIHIGIYDYITHAQLQLEKSMVGEKSHSLPAMLHVNMLEISLEVGRHT